MRAIAATRPLVIVALAVGLWLIVGNITAAASTCSAYTYYYSGYYTSDFPSYSYDGVEGDISVDGLTVSNVDDAHNIQYIDESSDADDCELGSCWSQSGYGIGNVGGNLGETATYQEAYDEFDSYYGYFVNFYPDTGTFGLAQNDRFQNFWDGMTESGGDVTCDSKSGLGQFEARMENNDGLGDQEMAEGWLDGYYCTQVYAQSEAENFATGACPSTPEYEYYGTNGSGSVSSSTELKLSYTGNANWFAWTSSVVPTDQHGPNSPYNLNDLSSYDAFDTWGS